MGRNSGDVNISLNRRQFAKSLGVGGVTALLIDRA